MDTPLICKDESSTIDNGKTKGNGFALVYAMLTNILVLFNTTF
jgi:hypothetical protein